MRKTGLLLMGLVLVFGTAMAEMATATFKIADGSGKKIQVIIDKKVINPEPKPLVRVKGSGGLHQVKIRVYGQHGLSIAKEQLHITPGYKNEFTIFINEHNTLEVKKTREYRMYNSQFKRPDNFYNKRFFALSGKKTPKRPTKDRPDMNRYDAIIKSWFIDPRRTTLQTRLC